MSAARRYLAALMAGAALATAAGCGSSDDEQGEPLPRDAVASIVQRLDEVQRRYDAGTGENNKGACDDIENDSYRAIDAAVEDLPDDVDADVRQALEESLSRLQELTSEGCSNVKEEPPETNTTPQEPPPPEPEPQPTVPEPTDTQETVPEEKPGKDKNKDKDNPGNGNGNGQQGGTGTQPGSNVGGQPAPEPGDG